METWSEGANKEEDSEQLGVRNIRRNFDIKKGHLAAAKKMPTEVNPHFMANLGIV
ncbi:MAG: hypothetical protein ACTFAK_04025 [Candidatus Electronema sp. VV]